MKRVLIAVSTFPALAALLAACGASDDAAGVGGVTAREAQALNQAAEMLDARADGADAALRGNQAE